MADLVGLQNTANQTASAAASAQSEYDALKAAANSSNFPKDANGQVIDVAGFMAARQAASNYLNNVLNPALAANETAQYNLTQAQSTVSESANTSSTTSTTSTTTTLPQPTASESAGEVVASNDQGNTQDPQPAPEPVTTAAEDGPTNSYQPGALTFDAQGRITNPNAETGTNPPVISTIQSQSVNADAFMPQYGTTDAEGRPVPGGTPGTPTNDDSGTRQNTEQIINSAFNAPITAQPNVLDKYASYTYNLSWYIMKPGALKAAGETGKRTMTDCLMLMQTGGGQPINASSNPGSAPGVRAPLFQYDYYMDNLQLESVIVGSATRMANNGTTLQFTVTEPNGITLINNLVKTAQSVYANSNMPYQVADYLMVIRFYGYDQNGNLVRAGGNNSTQQNVTVTTDTNAIVEKWYPFKLSNIKFKVSSKQIEYHVEGIIIPYYKAFGSDLGVIKAPVQMTGTTVKDILGGPSTPANSTPPADGRQSISTPSVPMAPQVNVGQGVLDAQAASGTVSTAFTNTQQPGLIGTAIPGVATSF